MTLRIITPNDGDIATITANPAMSATLPVTNLQDVSRARVARTTSTASQDVKLTWASAKNLSACALNRHNLTAVATWRLRLYSDAAWATLVYDSGTVDACPGKALGDLEWGIDPLGANLFTEWSHAFSDMYFDVTIARSAIISIDDAANPDGYLQASRLFIGRYIEPQFNFDYGVRMGWRDDSVQERTEGGTKRTDGVEPYRRMSFRLAHLSDSDRPKFQEFARRDGLREDFWISAHVGEGGANERDHAMGAKLVENAEISHTNPGQFGADYTVEEA